MKRSLLLLIGSGVLLFMSGCVDIALYDEFGDPYYGLEFYVTCRDSNGRESTGNVVGIPLTNHVIFSPIAIGANPMATPYYCRMEPILDPCCIDFVFPPLITPLEIQMFCGAGCWPPPY